MSLLVSMILRVWHWEIYISTFSQKARFLCKRPRLFGARQKKINDQRETPQIVSVGLKSLRILPFLVDFVCYFSYIPFEEIVRTDCTSICIHTTQTGNAHVIVKREREIPVSFFPPHSCCCSTC